MAFQCRQLLVAACHFGVLVFLLRVGRLQSRLLLAFILLLGLEILLSSDPRNGAQQVFAIMTVFGLLVYCRRAGLDPDTWYWLGIITSVLGASGAVAFLVQRDALPYVNDNVWPFLMLTPILITCLGSIVTVGAPHRRFVLALWAATNSMLVFLSGCRGCLSIVVVCLVFYSR